jgi:epoxyqueuosine reductase QueG
MPSLAERIKTRAAGIGFSKTGIVPAAELTVEGERLSDWLALGYHGEMA